MPGKVVRVLVKPGDDVKARQGLVVVEAMKVENELRAPRDGRVRRSPSPRAVRRRRRRPAGRGVARSNDDGSQSSGNEPLEARQDRRRCGDPERRIATAGGLPSRSA